MISIIIPVYNVETVLRRCLDSVVKQTYKNFEVLVIDDGSTDGSAVICDEYIGKDKRFRIFHKENGGLPSARNYGLDRMSDKSRFVCFIDSDDYVEPTWLQDYVKNHHGEDILIQNSRWWSGNQIKLDRKIDLRGKESLYERVESLALRNSLHSWAAMWNANIIRKHELRFPPYHYWEDVSFFISFSKHSKYINVIPNSNLHCYNYNYNYPQVLRKYNELKPAWFDVKVHVINEWWDFCRFWGVENRFCSYGNCMLQDLFYRLHEVFRSNRFSKEDKLKILENMNKLSVNISLPWKPLRPKIMSLCLREKPYYSYRLMAGTVLIL